MRDRLIGWAIGLLIGGLCIASLEIAISSNRQRRPFTSTESRNMPNRSKSGIQTYRIYDATRSNNIGEAVFFPFNRVLVLNLYWTADYDVSDPQEVRILHLAPEDNVAEMIGHACNTKHVYAYDAANWAPLE